MTAATDTATIPSELEPDNATRLAIFDAMSDAAEQGQPTLGFDELHERVIGRLRVLVPRELHNAGERTYLEDKIQACIHAGLLTSIGAANDRFALAPDSQAWIRYPDDSIRRYTPGLIAARERLDAVNSALRERAFDVLDHVPHHEPASLEFRALVRSMQEHGFLEQCRVFRFPDGRFVDGHARIAAAAEAGVDVKWLDLEAMRDPEKTRVRRRDTPLNRVQMALDSNATRLTENDQQRVLAAVAATVDRSWDEIASDLAATRAWRQATSPAYTPTFEAAKLPYDRDGAPQILATPDQKIGVRSLLRASGLAEYERDSLKDYVPFETGRVELRDDRGRRQRGPNKPTVFASAHDLIAGIEAMLIDPKRRKDPAAWEGALGWLHDYLGVPSGNHRTHKKVAADTPGP